MPPTARERDFTAWFGQDAIVDLDPQASTAAWGDARRKASDGIGEVEIFATPPGRLEAIIAAARKAGSRLILIDTPPHTESVALAAVRVADLILVPVRASFFDIAAIRSTYDILHLAGAIERSFAVLNTVPPRFGADVLDAEQALEDVGLRVAPQRLAERAAFRHAAVGGLAVAEFDRGCKAALEVAALANFCKKILKEKK